MRRMGAVCHRSRNRGLRVLDDGMCRRVPVMSRQDAPGDGFGSGKGCTHAV